MTNELKRAGKILQRINELAAISEEQGCITRTYGTAPFITGRNLVQQWMDEAGLHTRVDNIGNIRARLASSNSSASTFIIASHIDTIINAGRFDGPLGVLLGLDIVEQLVQRNTDLPFHIELIGFADEEGCRFHTTYLGSKVIAGSFDKNILKAEDDSGISLSQVIQENGGDIELLQEDALDGSKCLGYYEIHIEQGPVLYERKIPVGLVTAIAGQRRIGLVFKGEAGHAGTVPMSMRKDALACAAEIILASERKAANTDKLVATVGKLHIVHSASNVIPGEVMISLDIRSDDEQCLTRACDELKMEAIRICEDRSITLEWNIIQESAPVIADEKLNKLIAGAINASGHELVELVSGAGHDAVPIAAIAPVSMLFVRCYKGISHNPLESVELKDMAAAIKVSDNFIQRLIEANQ